MATIIYQRKRKSIWSRTFQWTVFWAGVAMLGVSFLGWGHSYGILGREASEEKVSGVEVGSQAVNRVPRKIEIQGVGIDLEVVPGRVIGDVWEVSESKVNYLVGSGVIGRPGNVVVYGHRRPHILSRLADVEIGQPILLESQDVVGIYEVTEIKVVGPEDVSILESDENAMLTIYTCDGWRDEDRLVVRARLVKESTRE